MIRNALAGLGLAALAGSGVMASGFHGTVPRTVHGVTLEADGLHASFAHQSDVYIAPLKHEKGSKALFSNIGFKYPKGLYFCCFGLTVSGVDSVLHSQTWIATAFMPKADATVTEIDAAVENAAGTNQADISLYTDDGGVPGIALKTFKVTGLQGVSGCCGLAVGKDAKGIPVKGGVTYWVAVTTDKKSSDTFDIWVDNSTDEIHAAPVAVNQGAGWQPAGNFIPRVSYAVFGK